MYINNVLSVSEQYSTTGIRVTNTRLVQLYRHCMIVGRDGLYDANAIATEPELLRPLINESWQVILL